MHYTYRPEQSWLETATWRNSQDAVLNSRTYVHDAYHSLTGINLNNASEVAYTLNNKDQRTAASHAVDGAWSYCTAINSNQPTYDADGNMLTTGGGWTYTMERGETAWSAPKRTARSWR